MEQAILEALAGGQKSVRELRRVAQTNQTGISTVLAKLRQSGQVVKTGDVHPDGSNVYSLPA